MPVVITDIQKVPATFQAMDAKGNPTAPGGPLVVTVDDATVLASNVIDDTHFEISAIGPLKADVPVSVTDGVVTAQDSVSVIGSAETTASISFGPPVDQ